MPSVSILQCRNHENVTRNAVQTLDILVILSKNVIIFVLCNLRSVQYIFLFLEWCVETNDTQLFPRLWREANFKIHLVDEQQLSMCSVFCLLLNCQCKMCYCMRQCFHCKRKYPSIDLPSTAESPTRFWSNICNYRVHLFQCLIRFQIFGQLSIRKQFVNFSY